MAAISACIDSWNWEDLLVSGPVPSSSPVPSVGNQTLPSLFRCSSLSLSLSLSLSVFSSSCFHPRVSQTASRRSSPASFARLLADSSRVIRPAFSQRWITLALVRSVLFSRAGDPLSRQPLVETSTRKTIFLLPFTGLESLDPPENDDEEREKKLRIFPSCLPFSKGFFVEIMSSLSLSLSLFRLVDRGHWSSLAKPSIAALSRERELCVRRMILGKRLNFTIEGFFIRNEFSFQLSWQVCTKDVRRNGSGASIW